MSSDKKLLVVLGATGVQGGAVVRDVLKDPVLSKEYAIRGITRDTTKPKAQALADKGVEVRSANMDDAASIRAALAGASAVFLVTNYWEIHDGEREFQQGRLVADVCKELGVQHLIASTLLSIKKISGGKYSGVDHFESKARIEEYVRSIGIPATFVLPGFYSSNCQFKPGEDGVYILYLNGAPDVKIPVLNAWEDFGKFVVAALRNPESVKGIQMLASSGSYSCYEIVEAYEAATDKRAKYVQIDDAAMLKFLNGSEDLLQNFQMMFDTTVGYYGGADLQPTLSLLVERPLSMKQYFEANISK